MTLTIVRLYHDLLGTYGDQGNAEVLLHRARARGHQVELVEVTPGQAVPVSGDIYLLGGGEDGPQTAALELLAGDGGLNRAVDAGSAVLAVCAGFQLIGTQLPGSGGQAVAGLGLVDAWTHYDQRPRSVGEVVVRSHEFPDQLWTGFENHQGVTRIGSDMTPLGHVLRGNGNGVDDDSGWQRVEGVRHGALFGTYMHGPVLARNPDLADAILSAAIGPLEPFMDALAQELAQERRATLWGGAAS